MNDKDHTFVTLSIAPQSAKIKICGIFREEDTEVLNEILPDYAGFVFAEKSRRVVTQEQARALRNKIDLRIITVGVFVDADPGFIASLVQEGTIGAVQLHGHEDAAYVCELKDRLRKIRGADAVASGRDIPVIYAVTVKSMEDVSAGTQVCHGDGSRDTFTQNKTSPCVNKTACADMLLFDQGAGGTGKTFDHDVIREAAANGALTKLPFFVAGGLNAENVLEVLDLPLFGVDVSGGVETDGVKDPEKIRQFADVVRRAGKTAEDERA